MEETEPTTVPSEKENIPLPIEPKDPQTEAKILRALILFDLDQMILCVPDFLEFLEASAHEVENISDYYPYRLMDYARNLRRLANRED